MYIVNAGEITKILNQRSITNKQIKEIKWNFKK